MKKISLIKHQSGYCIVSIEKETINNGDYVITPTDRYGKLDGYANNGKHRVLLQGGIIHNTIVEFELSKLKKVLIKDYELVGTGVDKMSVDGINELYQLLIKDKMEEKRIQEGNKLIAETVGEKIDLNKFSENWKKVISQHNNISEIPCYHSSWDWFVPAFNKIQKMKHDKDFCDLILSYIRHDDHVNAFKCLVNYINLVVINKPLEVNMEALKDLKKYL